MGENSEPFVLKISKNVLIKISILVILYILLGNARSVQENPLIPGATIAVNMIVPVLAGILVNKKAGFVVGVVGTTLNALTPVGSIFEFAAILPHGIMGFCAGWIRERAPGFVASGALVIGHLINITFFIGLGLISVDLIKQSNFWLGLLSETFVGILGIIVIVSVYRLTFEQVR